MIDNISITGITPLDCYPNKCSIKNSKQNIKSVSVCIPCQKPDLEAINEIKVTLCIDEFKLLNTILGPKVLVTLVSKIKVIYTAENVEQSLHSAHWDIKFCDFILLEDFCPSECDICPSNLFVGLEDVCVEYYDERCINLSLLYILCNRFYTNYSPKNYHCKCTKEYESNEYRKNYNYNSVSNLKNGLSTYYYPVEYCEDSSCHNEKNTYKKDIEQSMILKNKKS